MFKGLGRFICRAYACWLHRINCCDDDYEERSRCTAEFLAGATPADVEKCIYSERAHVLGYDWSVKDPKSLKISLSDRVQFERRLAAPINLEQFEMLKKTVGHRLEEARELYPSLLQKQD